MALTSLHSTPTSDGSRRDKTRALLHAQLVKISPQILSGNTSQAPSPATPAALKLALLFVTQCLTENIYKTSMFLALTSPCSNDILSYWCLTLFTFVKKNIQVESRRNLSFLISNQIEMKSNLLTFWTFIPQVRKETWFIPRASLLTKKQCLQKRQKCKWISVSSSHNW